ncbi:MAG TPA: hypothetical protein VKE70_28390 [Candidatus Solibacter sp.]|nr:hypothetical protein [Candidatus Solibacter sp.]
MRLLTFIASALVITRGALAQPAENVTSTTLEAAALRHGESSSTLAPVAQRITFVKTDSDDPKAAIANTLITQVGFNLLTMGVGSQMLRWNPYMGEAFSQFTNIGKGLLTGHGAADLKGFEYDTLPGVAAPLTVKPQPVELLIPLEPFRPTAEFSAESVQPVLLRLQVRLDDSVRVMAAHKVAIKQEKKGRFDLKPKSERQESGIEERAIPVNFERQPGNILRVTTREALEPGEYALVLRSSGAPTQNVALKPVAVAAPAVPAAPAAPPERPKGLFGAMKAPKAPAPDSTPQTATVGFLAWDFRVVE